MIRSSDASAAGIVSKSCLIDPRWKRKVFSVAGRDYVWLDVFLAAMLRREWQPFEAQLRESLACLADARSRRELPHATRIEEAATAFRYDRDLLTTDETIAWIQRAGLTIDAWIDYLVGRLLRNQWNERLAGLLPCHGESLTISDSAFSAEGICSGCFDRQAMTLAGRAAVSAGCVDMLREPIDLGHIQRTRGDHAAWLASLGPADLARLVHLAGLESTFESRTRANITPEALAAQVARHRLDWIRIDLERLIFDSADAAREAAWCVREDGVTLCDVAIELRLQVRDSRGLLERLEPELRDVVLGAGEDQLVGPVQIGSRHELVWVAGKAAPDLADPLVCGRAAEAVVEHMVAQAVLSHVRWVDRARL